MDSGTVENWDTEVVGHWYCGTMGHWDTAVITVYLDTGHNCWNLREINSEMPGQEGEQRQRGRLEQMSLTVFLTSVYASPIPSISRDVCLSVCVPFPSP